ncbi:ParA family protein [Rhodopseudomonas palustris]|uniref:ParA family protein n=1 Tax=Rhodopseudomonas palustris TaxID=1076 RepID=UPI000E5BBEFA|nr:ParA family protein [Rhodopseudomonas palustris]QLH72033.1 ParA family protein [Rhodopseudomonas palustris]RHZ94647.1 ParA family protein [Rhodopseudomonas palustris]
MPFFGSLCFFNNKGGVGKTTLACNVASYIAETQELRVLVVDADPQCNATQLILPNDTTEQLYATPAGHQDIDSLKQVLQPLIAGDASLRKDHKIAGPSTNRFGTFILPGHPDIAILEDTLSSNWSSFLGESLGGARVSNWNTQLLAQLRPNYDLIIYDVGPSLGALNRSILIGVDYFLAPMGCDIFSLIGIDNIAKWITQWQDNYDHAYNRMASKGNSLEEYEGQIRKTSNVMSRFVGYTVQQYITKTIRDEKRATGAYEKILEKIPSQIAQSLGPFKAPRLQLDEVHLGDVPHMYSLVPLAQTNHTPIHKLTGGEGLSGGQYQQQRQYKTFIADLSDALMRNLRENAEALR